MVPNLKQCYLNIEAKCVIFDMYINSISFFPLLFFVVVVVPEVEQHFFNKILGAKTHV